MGYKSDVAIALHDNISYIKDEDKHYVLFIINCVK
jgi:hypothetical protein